MLLSVSRKRDREIRGRREKITGGELRKRLEMS
jgi:hypothetical protein